VTVATETQAQQQTLGTAGLDQGEAMFERGLEAAKEWAQRAALGLAVWAEKSPEQVVLAGLLTGFMLGKIFFRAGRSFE
jgi:uncharacterized protein (UPF0548 family)